MIEWEEAEPFQSILLVGGIRNSITEAKHLFLPIKVSLIGQDHLTVCQREFQVP